MAPLRIRPGAEIHQRPEIPRDPRKVPKEVRRAISLCRSQQAPWPLMLHGGVGTGKTCAALCLCDYAHSADYWLVRGLCDHLNLARAGNLDNGVCNVTIGDIWETWARCELGVLDELGSRPLASDHERETVQRALDLRFRKPTLLVSNISPQEFGAVYDPRVRSRACTGTICEVGGPDRRLL